MSNFTWGQKTVSRRYWIIFLHNYDLPAPSRTIISGTVEGRENRSIAVMLDLVGYVWNTKVTSPWKISPWKNLRCGKKAPKFKHNFELVFDKILTWNFQRLIFDIIKFHVQYFITFYKRIMMNLYFENIKKYDSYFTIKACSWFPPRG